MVEVKLELSAGVTHAIGRAPNGQGVYVESGALRRIRELAGKDSGSLLVKASALVKNSQTNPPWKLERKDVVGVSNYAVANGYQNVLVIVPSTDGTRKANDFLVGWMQNGRKCKVSGEAALEIVRRVCRPGNYVFRLVLEPCGNGNRDFACEATSSSQVGDRLERK